MALRHRRFREISQILPRIHSGDHLLQCGLVTKLSALSIIPHSHALERIDTEISQCGFRAERLFQAPNHVKSITRAYWSKGGKDSLKKDGTFLVLAGQFLETSLTTSCDAAIIVRSHIVQGFPRLHIMGFVSGGSIHSAADRSHLIQYILKEYITFPIMLSNRNFTEMENRACRILFKGFKSPVVYHEKDMDLRVLNKVALRNKPGYFLLSTSYFFSTFVAREGKGIQNLHQVIFHLMNHQDFILDC